MKFQIKWILIFKNSNTASLAINIPTIGFYSNLPEIQTRPPNLSKLSCGAAFFMPDYPDPSWSWMSRGGSKAQTVKEGERNGAWPDQINTLINVPNILQCTLERTVPLINGPLQYKKVAFVILAQRQLRQKEGRTREEEEEVEDAV